MNIAAVQNHDGKDTARVKTGYSASAVAVTWGRISLILKNTLHVLAASGERQRTQRDALLAFAIRIMSAGILYLTQIALARWMGGHEYGIYVSVWTWVLILGAIPHLGLNLAVLRLAPVYRETGDFNRLRGLMHATRYFALAAGTVMMAFGLLGVWLLQDHIDNYFVLPIYLALVCVPLYALTDVQDGIGRGNAWMNVALVPPYILRPLLLLGAMFVAWAADLPMDAATAAAAAIVATWLSGILQTLMLNKRMHETVPAGPRTTDFRTWLNISLPLLAMMTAELLIQNTDILVVTHFMSPADVGIYFAAGKTMALIMFVHYAVGSAVAHKFAALHARGDREELRRFVKDSVNWTFWPSLAAAVVILALGKPLLTLFGPQFASGYPVMCILVVGFLMRSANGPAEYLLNMLGEQKICAAVLFGAALVNIALNVLLVPHFGLIGAASSTAISLTGAGLLYAIVIWRRLGINITIWTNLPKL